MTGLDVTRHSQRHGVESNENNGGNNFVDLRRTFMPPLRRMLEKGEE